MKDLEEKKIVIRLPRLKWSSFLNLRFGIACALLLLAGVFAYWYQAVRPFVWISGAHVEAFSTLVSADVAGRIAEMGPQEGELVKKGQALFTLDREAILSKQAQARRKLDSLKEQIEFEKERIGKVLEDYLTATNEMELGVGTQEKVNKQLTLMEDAQEKSEQASSQIAGVQAMIADLDLQMKKLTLFAPFDGVILKRTKNPGAVVSFGESIYSLCDPERLWIEAEIPENEVSHVTIGTEARIRLPAYPGKEWSGKVTYIAPSTTAKSSLLPFSEEKVTIPIKIALDDPRFSLKPGLSAQVGLKVR